MPSQLVELPACWYIILMSGDVMEDRILSQYPTISPSKDKNKRQHLRVKYVRHFNLIKREFPNGV